LEGERTKWNNNGGTVRNVLPVPTDARFRHYFAEFGVILEEPGSDFNSDDDGKVTRENDMNLLNQVPVLLSFYLHALTKKDAGLWFTRRVEQSRRLHLDRSRFLLNLPHKKKWRGG
jgi:hypothetical protein